jgi:hypothetical protein
MGHLRTSRARRVPALVAMLGLFLLGSNYCVLAGLSGDTRMPCLTVATDASTQAVPPCHRPAPEGDSDPRSPAGHPSCCPDPVVAPAAAAIERIDAASITLPHAAPITLAAPASPVQAAWHGHRPAPDGDTPARITHAPVPARAPPLA